MKQISQLRGKYHTRYFAPDFSIVEFSSASRVLADSAPGASSNFDEWIIADDDIL